MQGGLLPRKWRAHDGHAVTLACCALDKM